MKAVQPSLRNGENTQWVVVSQISLDCEWDLLNVLKGSDGLWRYACLVESLSEQGYVAVCVSNHLAKFAQLNAFQLLYLEELRLAFKQIEAPTIRPRRPENK